MLPQWKRCSWGWLKILLNCPVVWKWVIDSPSVYTWRDRLEVRLLEIVCCVLCSVTSNQYKLTSLAELHKVLAWRDSCPLHYFLRCWQITGALQISGSEQISIRKKKKKKDVTAQDSNVDSGGFTYVRLTTALNPPAQVLTNKDERKDLFTLQILQYFISTHQTKYDTLTFLLDLSYSETLLDCIFFALL